MKKLMRNTKLRTEEEAQEHRQSDKEGNDQQMKHRCVQEMAGKTGPNPN